MVWWPVNNKPLVSDMGEVVAVEMENQPELEETASTDDELLTSSIEGQSVLLHPSLILNDPLFVVVFEMG